MLRYLATGLRDYATRPVRPYARGLWEFEAVIAGAMRPIVAGAESDRQRHLWLFGPDCVHGWTATQRRPAEVVVFHFPEVPDGLARRVGPRGWCGIDLETSAIAQLQALAAASAHELAEPDGLSPLRHQRCLIELALLIGSGLGLAHQEDPQRGRELVDSALAWAAARLADGADVGGMARAVHCSPAHLRRLFHRERGCSPRSALDDLRLGRARDLLGDPHLGLAAIAEQCGYGNASALSRAFTRGHRCSPDAWRRRQAQHRRSADG